MSVRTLALIGLFTAAVIRGGLFVLSFGVFAPGLGWMAYGSLAPAAAQALELLVTAALIGIGVYLATGDRAPRAVIAAGAAFIVDSIAYAIQIPLFYRGQDAPEWMPVLFASLQLPLVVIAGLMIVRARPSAALSTSAP
jgi:hypothetical protein